MHYCGSALVVENRGGGVKKYLWVLGDTQSGEHCGVCLARAGKVKTGPEWAAMGMPPCNCHCTLEPVDEDAKNRWSNVARAARKRRSAISTGSAVSELSGEGDVSRGGAEETGGARGGQAGFGAGETGEVTAKVFKFTERQRPLRLETLDKAGCLCEAISNVGQEAQWQLEPF